MKKYEITGMSCAACQARVEKAVSKVEGVESCSVSLLTNSMGVNGTADDKDIIEAVEKAGYGASVFGGAERSKNGLNGIEDMEEALRDKDSPVIVKRLISSVVVLVILMYYSMGHMMLGWPVIFPVFENHVALATLEMLLAIIVMVINKKFFNSGFTSLIHGFPNMDTLVALGSTASFGYSLVVLFLMIEAMGRHDMDMVMRYSMNLYFESAAMIPTLITVGKLLEAKSKGRTTDALKSLMKLAPKEAVLESEDFETLVPIEDVKPGDIYILKAGDIVPVDGVIISGSSALNEAALTGESIPVDKTEGDTVSAGTINTNGYLRCRATRVGEDTTLSQIIQMVGDAAATKAPLARIADKVSAVFVPAVIALAVITFAVWMVIGKDVSFSIARAISVLVISCPCALGLATPVAIMVGNGMGAKHGILYKTAEVLEEAGRVGVVVLDKTGTITKGTPGVTDIEKAEGISQDDFLQMAYSLEKRSEHPLAKAIVEYSEDGIAGLHNTKLEAGELVDFETLPGAGVRGKDSSGRFLEAGSFSYMMSVLNIEDDQESYIQEKCEELASEGKTPLVFASDKKFMGIIAVADLIKEDSADSIEELRGMGIRTVMLTGDNEITAKAVAQKAGVDDVIAGVMPEDKENVISKLQEVTFGKKKLKVAMVGDGINDAPALTRADIGIAIGAGTDVAIDAAGVVLMKSSLKDVAGAIRMSRATIRNIHENLFWAFFYNALCIPLAMGVYGIAMKPMYGAAAMALSSFFVCMNALRLNLVNIHDSGRDRAPSELRTSELKESIDNVIETIKLKKQEKLEKQEQNEKGDKMMTKTLKIEGMMCGHCEATVKKALEKIDGVTEAVVSHEQGTAVVTFDSEVADEVLKTAVEDKDYTVLSIE
ncbi:MAG: heavy metal translocating P-type ATPase [Eubacterium sp.]|nr:heavy metal translocating P-type ATPase [Eubacterium sp.]